MAPLLLPLLLHPGGVSWDELLLIAIGLVVLVVIAFGGGKPKKPPDEPETELPPDENNS
jgi:hypothetical protein